MLSYGKELVLIAYWSLQLGQGSRIKEDEVTCDNQEAAEDQRGNVN